jgi:hypothetical protein
MLDRAQLRRRKITTDDKNVPPVTRTVRLLKEGQDLSFNNLVL